MTVKILDVGNCDPDHSSISALLQANFDVAIDRTHGFADAMESVRSQQYGLVLINRLMDRDGSPGIEIIKAVKSDPATAETKVMMITNFAEHQEIAVNAGAVAGFGKAALHEPETLAILSEHLAVPKS